MLLVLAIFLIFVVYPLVLIMYKSVVNPADNSFTLANFTRFFTRKYYTNTLLNSFKVTVVSTLISATLGLAIAYITRQYRIAGSKALNICIVVSYLSPPFIGAYAWIQLLGRNGLFTKWINAIFVVWRHIRLCRHCAGVLAPVLPAGVYVCLRRAAKPG